MTVPWPNVRMSCIIIRIIIRNGSVATYYTGSDMGIDTVFVIFLYNIRIL